MKKCPWCGQEYPDEVLACANDQNTLESCDPKPSTPVSREQDSAAADIGTGEIVAPEGFRLLSAFDAFEADRLLKRFLEADIRFQIEKIERRERSTYNSYRTVGYIAIFIHEDDFEKADRIFTEDWKV